MYLQNSNVLKKRNSISFAVNEMIFYAAQLRLGINYDHDSKLRMRTMYPSNYICFVLFIFIHFNFPLKTTNYTKKIFSHSQLHLRHPLYFLFEKFLFEYSSDLAFKKGEIEKCPISYVYFNSAIISIYPLCIIYLTIFTFQAYEFNNEHQHI